MEDLLWEEGRINYIILGYSQELNNPIRRQINTDTNWSSLEANSDLFQSEMNNINSQISDLWKEYAVDTMICSVGLCDKNAAQILKLSKAMYTNNIKQSEMAIAGIKYDDKGFSKEIVYAADVFGIWADYYQKKKLLEEDYEQAKLNSMVCWFYSSNLYNINENENVLYNVGIYDAYTIERIKKWNQSGISSFCKREDIEEILSSLSNKYFYIEDGEIILNEKEWKQICESAEFSEEEMKDAMLLILYGTEGIEMEGKKYVSSNDNVVSIEPHVFSICVSKINDALSKKQGEKALQNWWDN